MERSDYHRFQAVYHKIRTFLERFITKFGVFYSVLSQNSEPRRQKNSGKAVLLHGAAGVGLLLHAEQFHLFLPGERQVGVEFRQRKRPRRFFRNGSAVDTARCFKLPVP